MSDRDYEKDHIHDEIERARSGVSEHIDQLDRKLRSAMDMSAHAPKIIAAGAAVGFAIGFGVPSALKRALQIGLPAYVAWKMVRSRWGAESEAV